MGAAHAAGPDVSYGGAEGGGAGGGNGSNGSRIHSSPLAGCRIEVPSSEGGSMPGERSEADCASQGSSGGAGIGSSSRGVVGRAWESGGSADGGSPHDRASIS